MASRSDVDCSHFAPTRRPSDAHRGEPAGWRRRLAAKDQVVELLRLRLMQLGHEMAVAIEGRLNRGMTQLRLYVLRVGAVGDQETGISVAEVMETREELDGISVRAQVELQQRAPERRRRQDGFASLVAPIDTDVGTIEAELIEPLLTLARSLQRATNVDVATTALREADEALDLWEQPWRTAPERHDAIWLPFGVELRLPDRNQRG